MISVAEAHALILKEARSFGRGKVALEKSVGRVLAQNVVADRDYPPFNRSVMDGYAVIAEDYAAGKDYRIEATVYAGDAPLRGMRAANLSAIKIMTGASVPTPYNAVIRREDAEERGGHVRFAVAAVKRGENISKQGEDLKKKDRIVLQGRRIDNATLGLLASLGIHRPQVSRLPTVELLSTGNEVVSPSQKPGPTQIRNSNAYALRSLLADFAITGFRAQHVADDPQKLKMKIKAATGDILMLTGGVSAGDTDYVPEVLESLGYKKIFHKVAMKPGKPLWFGAKGKKKVFAIPGNPLSCQVIFRIFIEPFLRRSLGMPDALPLCLPLAEARRKKDTLENFFPVKIESVSGSVSTLSELPYNGSGDIRAALFSDGLAAHPAATSELATGAMVDFYPWRTL